MFRGRGLQEDAVEGGAQAQPSAPAAGGGKAPAEATPAHAAPAVAALPARDRFVSPQSSAEVYFEDAESRTKHLVRTGCGICSNPEPCQNPTMVPDAYLASLELGMDFECPMMHNGLVDQGIIDGLPGTSTTVAVVAQVHAVSAARATTKPPLAQPTASPAGDHSAGDIILEVVVVLLILSLAGFMAWKYLRKGSCPNLLGGHRGLDAKAGDKKSLKKRTVRERTSQDADRVPLMAPTIGALPPGPQEQLPGTLRALAPPPEATQQQQYAPTITSLQQLQHYAQLPGTAVGGLAAMPTDLLAAQPGSFAASPGYASAQQSYATAQQQQQQQWQSAGAAGAMGGLPSSMLACGTAAAIAPAQEYDLVTVTPDGFQVTPLPAGTMPPTSYLHYPNQPMGMM